MDQAVLSLADVDRVEVVVVPVTERPEQVVVPVDHGVVPQQVARTKALTGVPAAQGVVGQHGDRDRLLGDPAVEDGLDEVVDGHPQHLHRGLLVLEREVAAVARAQPAGQEEHVPLGRDAGRRPEREQLLPVRGLELDLLEQLALRRLERVLAIGVAQAGRQLQIGAGGRMAVLAHARHPLVVVDGQDDDGAGVLEDPPVEGVGIGSPGARIESLRSATIQSSR